MAESRSRPLLKRPLRAGRATRDPFERLVDTGLRLHALGSASEVHEALVTEAAQILGAQRVLLVLDTDAGLRGAGAKLPPAEDADSLQDLVRRHLAETGSAVAARLLDDWTAALGRFVKVMPKDYKRVLAAAQRAERDGLDVNEAVMAAARG